LGSATAASTGAGCCLLGFGGSRPDGRSHISSAYVTDVRQRFEIADPRGRRMQWTRAASTSKAGAGRTVRALAGDLAAPGDEPVLGELSVGNVHGSRREVVSCIRVSAGDARDEPDVELDIAVALDEDASSGS
jgi:hypothetical protein